MIDQKFQGRGYGRATVREVVRRLKLMPEIEFIGTSVAHGNIAAEQLYRSLGFVESGLKVDDRELYLKLDWDPDP